ncbi:MAG: alpha/beta fold hydrolase, partial [Solirubrobacteraceae bacterium]
MYSTFTPAHRGGSGSPLVCLHGFTGTWRTWELVLPTLERHHDVLAPTLLGHAGGPPLADELSEELIPAAVERAMDEAGFETAHIVGNSLGGYVALQLAARGRATSVVALAPAGGWAVG